MTAKVYVDVLAVFSREGELIPTAFVWEDGRKYAIDKVSKPERCASRKAGGTGYRYPCQVGGKICHLHNCPPSRPLPQPDQSLYCLFHSQSVTVLTSLHADSAEISAVG